LIVAYWAVVIAAASGDRRNGAAVRTRLSGSSRQWPRPVAFLIPVAALLPDERDIVVGRAICPLCGAVTRSGDELGFVVDRRHARRPRRTSVGPRHRRGTAKSMAQPSEADGAADAFVFCCVRRHFFACQHLGAGRSPARIPAALPGGPRQDKCRACRAASLSGAIGEILHSASASFASRFSTSGQEFAQSVSDDPGSQMGAAHRSLPAGGF